jgi:hypothetical protein
MHPVSLARPTEHIVTFYRSDDFVVEQLASFISEGLAANEHVIAIATTRHWNAITGRLEESGIAYAARPAPDSWSSSRRTRPWTPSP